MVRRVEELLTQEQIGQILVGLLRVVKAIGRLILGASVRHAVQPVEVERREAAEQVRIVGFRTGCLHAAVKIELAAGVVVVVVVAGGGGVNSCCWNAEVCRNYWHRVCCV